MAGDPVKPGGRGWGEGFTALDGPLGGFSHCQQGHLPGPLTRRWPGALTQSRGPCSHWGGGPSTFHQDPESSFSSKSAQDAHLNKADMGLNRLAAAKNKGAQFTLLENGLAMPTLDLLSTCWVPGAHQAPDGHSTFNTSNTPPNVHLVEQKTEAQTHQDGYPRSPSWSQ